MFRETRVIKFGRTDVQTHVLVIFHFEDRKIEIYSTVVLGVNISSQRGYESHSTGCIFNVSPNTAGLSHRKPASTEISFVSSSAEAGDKRDAP
jgi:hypothetical protein